DGHYFCRAGGNRPDGLNEPVTIIFKAQRLYMFPRLSSGRWISGEAYIWCDTIFHHAEVSIPVELEF
ncbi:hypothetical protein FQE89_18060, partial [Escherichia coli]|nr:hypothetical protein [Escherichia coli]